MFQLRFVFLSVCSILFSINAKFVNVQDLNGIQIDIDNNQINSTDLFLIGRFNKSDESTSDRVSTASSLEGQPLASYPLTPFDPPSTKSLQEVHSIEELWKNSLTFDEEGNEKEISDSRADELLTDPFDSNNLEPIVLENFGPTNTKNNSWPLGAFNHTKLPKGFSPKLIAKYGIPKSLKFLSLNSSFLSKFLPFSANFKIKKLKDSEKSRNSPVLNDSKSVLQQGNDQRVSPNVTNWNYMPKDEVHRIMLEHHKTEENNENNQTSSEADSDGVSMSKVTVTRTCTFAEIGGMSFRKNYRYTTIREVSQVSFQQCEQLCSLEDRCRSANLLYDKRTDIVTCQLKRESVRISKKWNIYKLQQTQSAYYLELVYCKPVDNK